MRKTYLGFQLWYFHVYSFSLFTHPDALNVNVNNFFGFLFITNYCWCLIE